jgi:CheY-like chemotaxis protein
MNTTERKACNCRRSHFVRNTHTGATMSQQKILVVEDNPALASVVRFNLSRAGFDVTVAKTGLEAWELLESGESVDMVVTDHQMPEMTGCELCMRIRQHESLADLPIIMLTAKGLELELPRLRNELGILEVYPKPFSPIQLVQAVKQHLSGIPSG